MEPVVERLKNKYKPLLNEFRIINIRTTEGRDKLIVFGITATPTFVLLGPNEKELDRISGDIPEENMIKFINQFNRSKGAN